MRGLGGPRADVDAWWSLCCGAVVGGSFAGGQQSVFDHSLSFVLWVTTWGCCGGLTVEWVSSGRGQSQQVCGFSVRMWQGATTWGCPWHCSLFSRDSPDQLYCISSGRLLFGWLWCSQQTASTQLQCGWGVKSCLCLSGASFWPPVPRPRLLQPRLTDGGGVWFPLRGGV